jgi:HAD superfamily hydrolase (TIGR01509 family)
VFGDGLWQRLEVGTLGGDAFLQTVLGRLGRACTAASTEDLRQAWCAILTLRSGVDALLAGIAAPCLVWSNTDPIHAARIQAEPVLADRMAHWSLSYQLGVEKPCAAFFQRALEQAALAPWQVVYVDDRSDNVAQARALGVDALVARSLPAVRAGLHARGLLRT